MGISWAEPIEINLALSSRPSNLNPFFSTDSNSQNIGRLIHISLIDFDEQMRPRCRLCESFSESYKNGGHQIIFKLKRNITFWDGQEIKAFDVAQAVKLYQTDEEAIKSIFRFAFSKIKKVIINSDYQVSLYYEKFNLENISNLVLLKILKLKKSLSDYQKVRIEDIIGAGEYYIDKINPFSIKLLPRKSDLSVLVFKVVKDETTLALKILNGEIDISLADTSSRKIEWIRDNLHDRVNILNTSSSIYRYIALNHKRKLFKIKDVRRALSLLIPRNKILKYKLKDNADLSFGLFSRVFKGQFYEAEIDRYNPKKAGEILDRAGFLKNKDGVRFSLEWKSTNNYQILEIIRIIKYYLKKAGIEVRIVTQEWGAFMKSIKSGNYDIYTSQWIGFTGPDMFYYLFHSKSFPPKGGNRVFYTNERVDDLLDLAGNQIDFKKRNFYYKKIQKAIAEDLPYINLWHPKVVWITRSCINLPQLYPTGSFLPLLRVQNLCK